MSSDPGMVRVTSSAFDAGGRLSAPYNCAGGGTSPPITIQHDPQAETWGVHATSTPVNSQSNQSSTSTTSQQVTHWLIWNIPNGQALSAGIPHGNPVEKVHGATQGKNDFGVFGYSLGCPLNESRSLTFAIFVLDTALTVSPTISVPQFVKKVYNSTHFRDGGSISVTVNGA